MPAADAHSHFLGTWILDHPAYPCHHLCPCLPVMSQGLTHCCNHHCWHLSMPSEGPKTHLIGPAITSAHKHHVVALESALLAHCRHHGCQRTSSSGVLMPNKASTQPSLTTMPPKSLRNSQMTLLTTKKSYRDYTTMPTQNLSQSTLPIQNYRYIYRKVFHYKTNEQNEK